MISLISFIIVLVGAFNWLSIGVLQFDFIAGIFGSQANIFSRVVYAIVGFAAFWLIYATIKQRGRIIVNGKKENDAKLLGKLKDRLTKDDKKGDNKEDYHKEYKKDNSEPQNNQNQKTEAVSAQTTEKPNHKTEPDDTVPPIKMEDDKMIGLGADNKENN